MSKVSRKSFHTPFNSQTVTLLLGHMHAAKSEQLAAADLAGSLMAGGIAKHAGKVNSIFVQTSVVCGAGESMDIDVLKNGASILTAPYTIDDTTPINTQIDLPLVLDTEVAIGDVLTATRNYTAGGTATPMTSTLVQVEWAHNVGNG